MDGIWWIWNFNLRKYVNTGEIGATPAQTLGAMANVNDNADESSNEDLWLCKKAGTDHWQPQALPKQDPSEVNNITVDSEMSDTSDNPVANRIIKAYADLHPRYAVVDDIDAPVLPDGEVPESGTPATPSTFSAVKMRLRAINGVLFIDSDADISSAKIQLGRLGRSYSARYFGEPVKKNGWRIYDHETVAKGTRDFTLQYISLSAVEWSVTGYPYRYKVLFNTDEGSSYAAAWSLTSCFGSITSDSVRIRSGHNVMEVISYALVNRCIQASQVFAIVVDGDYLPFRVTISNEKNEEGFRYGITPL